MPVVRFACLLLPLLLLAACTIRTGTQPQETEPEPPPRMESVTVDSLNVRSGPSTGYSVIETIHKDDSVEVLDREGKWINIVTPEGQDGWAHGGYLTGFDDIERPRVVTEAYSSLDTVKVHSGPGTEHGVVEVIHKNDIVEVMGRDGDWVKVRTPLNQYGWVYGPYLTDTAPATQEEEPADAPDSAPEGQADNET